MKFGLDKSKVNFQKNCYNFHLMLNQSVFDSKELDLWCLIVSEAVQLGFKLGGKQTMLEDELPLTGLAELKPLNRNKGMQLCFA